MRDVFGRGAAALIALSLMSCSGAAPPPVPASGFASSQYVIGPGDSLSIFVWRNSDLSVEAPVRPDGRISIPLVEDIVAVGKTPATLARDIEKRLSVYVSQPIVTVIAKNFIGPFSRQIRIVGEAVQPRAIPYRANMTVLDAMIEAGGLTKFASGDRATLVRTVNGEQQSYGLHLDSLIKDGDIRENVALVPGDIIIIPQRFF